MTSRAARTAAAARRPCAKGRSATTARPVSALRRASPHSAPAGVDTTPPQTTIDSGPSGPTNDSTPSFGFSSSESGSTFECRVDAAAFAGCTSPFTSSHALRRRPHLRGPCQRRRDQRRPDPRPALLHRRHHAAADDDRLRPLGPDQRLDTDLRLLQRGRARPSSAESTPPAFAACTSPYTTAPLSDGAHTFEVRATDGAGNVDPTPAQRSFTVDTTPPQTTIDSGPSGTTNDPTPTFGFSSEAGRHLPMPDRRRRLRRLHLSLHRRPALRRRPQLRSPRHRRSRQRRPDPGLSAASPSTPRRPQTTIDSGPYGHRPTTRRRPSASPSEAGSTFECRVDAAAFAACTSPYTAAPLSDGAHSFEVRATDGAGNVDPTPAQRSFTVDTTPPQTTIDSGPEGTDQRLDTELRASPPTRPARPSNAASTPPRFTPCSSPYTAAPLSDGAHSFEVRATDGAGNVDPTPASRSFNVDTTAEPGVTLARNDSARAPPAETVPVLESEVFPSPQIAPAPVTFSFDGIKHGEQAGRRSSPSAFPVPARLSSSAGR